MSRACNRPNQSNRVFRASWMFYMCKSRRNELVVSIAILAIVALFVPRFSHVACTIAKKVPRAKRVPIKKRLTHGISYVGIKICMRTSFQIKSTVPFTVHTLVFTVFFIILRYQYFFTDIYIITVFTLLFLLQYKYFLLATTHLSLVLYTVCTLFFTVHYYVNTVQVLFDDYYATFISMYLLLFIHQFLLFFITVQVFSTIFQGTIIVD